jgi:beta-glucanase (GH16 family)
MPTSTRPRFVAKSVSALTCLGVLTASALALIPNADAAPIDLPPVVVAANDTGVLDVTGDGVAEFATYGERNAGLSVGEQGADGWELRYVAPFSIPDVTRWNVGHGGSATLQFRVWRTDDLEGRNLVITALPGDRAGTSDFTRPGVEVFRGAPRIGVTTVDVARAIRELNSRTVTFRFAADRPPTKGDFRFGQINIATADGRPENRPTLRVTAASADVPSPYATPTTAAPRPAPAPAPPAPAPTTTAPPAPRAASAPAGMSLAFSDEFDGTSLNTSVWKPYHSTYGDGNRELQCHTPDNVAVSSGTLQITARRQTVTCPNGSVRQFSSGFLGTRETGTYFPRYGRFEVRARVPHGQGLWPAFWLRHRDGASIGEVDIMEYFHSQVPGKTTATVHLDRRYNLSKKTVDFEAPTATPGWHTWAVDIIPVSNGVRFTFLLDGRPYHSYTDTQRHWAGAYPGQNLWDIALNLSVGGDWVGKPDDRLGYLSDLSACAQWGSAAGSCSTTGIRRADFPSTYEIDYVRVFKRS